MSYGDISVTDMMAVIAKARLAERAGDPTRILNELRTLTPMEVIAEFHRAVAALSKLDALSARDRAFLSAYASDYLSNPQLAV